MIAADRAVQRPPYAKLMVVDARRRIGHVPRSALVKFLRSEDLVIANDAATLPASLQGVHSDTGALIEVRLAGRPSLRPEDVGRFSAVVFGQGDFRMRTEDRPPPPPLAVGDRLALGPLRATIERLLDHPRFVSLIFDGAPDQIWAGPGTPRPAHPVRAHQDAARALGCVDANRGSARRFRASVRKLRARLACASHSARARDGVRNNYPRCRHFVYR